MDEHKAGAHVGRPNKLSKQSLQFPVGAERFSFVGVHLYLFVYVDLDRKEAPD